MKIWIKRRNLNRQDSSSTRLQFTSFPLPSPVIKKQGTFSSPLYRSSYPHEFTSGHVENSSPRKRRWSRGKQATRRAASTRLFHRENRVNKRARSKSESVSDSFQVHSSKTRQKLMSREIFGLKAGREGRAGRDFLTDSFRTSRSSSRPQGKVETSDDNSRATARIW